VHEDHSGILRWIEKHNGYAAREAQELLAGSQENGIPVNLFGAQAERKRWIRERVWNRLPPLARPFAYFGYRYVLRGGFRDGTAGLMYHFLQGLWFPFLVDVKYIEIKRHRRHAHAEYPARGPRPTGR
jgi:hypothetical protein